MSDSVRESNDNGWQPNGCLYVVKVCLIFLLEDFPQKIIKFY